MQLTGRRKQKTTKVSRLADGIGRNSTVRKRKATEEGSAPPGEMPVNLESSDESRLKEGHFLLVDLPASAQSVQENIA